MQSPDGVGDAVGTHFEGIAISDLQPRLDPRLQDERIEAEVLSAAAPQRVDEIWNDGTERDLLDTRRIGVVLPKDAPQEEAKLVRRDGRPGGPPKPER